MTDNIPDNAVPYRCQGCGQFLSARAVDEGTACYEADGLWHIICVNLNEDGFYFSPDDPS